MLNVVVKVLCILALLGGCGFVATFVMYVCIASRNDPDDIPMLDRIQNLMIITMCIPLVCMLFAGAIAISQGL